MKKLHGRELSRNQPIICFDVILQHDWPIKQCLLHIRVFFGGKTKRPCFDLLIHWLIKHTTNTYRNHFPRSYANRSILHNEIGKLCGILTKATSGNKKVFCLLAIKDITYLDSSSWCDLDPTTLLSDATSLRISSRIIRFPSGVFSSSLLLFTWVLLVTLKVESAVDAMYEHSLAESVFSNFNKRKNNVY